jgi:hypothetical protein
MEAGRSGGRKKKDPFLERKAKTGRERVAPPVGRRRPSVDRSGKKVIDKTGLLMEAATVRECSVIEFFCNL